MSTVVLQLVADEGGFDLVCRDRRWTKIALQMGFAPGKAIGSHLRAHYEKVLYPYNLFQSGANLLVSAIMSRLVLGLVLLTPHPPIKGLYVCVKNLP